MFMLHALMPVKCLLIAYKLRIRFDSGRCVFVVEISSLICSGNSGDIQKARTANTPVMLNNGYVARI